MEQDNELQEILKKYLSHIVYIDDEFKITWNTQENEEKLERPPRGRRNIAANGKEESVTENEKITSVNDNLENFCLYVQERYPDLLMTPLLYREDSVNDEKLSEHMRTARLLILDWKLTERKTAISLLKMVRSANQLRFCVIYTSKFEEARNEFVEEILSGEDDKLKETEGKSYLFARVDSVIYMLCEKDKFDLDGIIESLVEVFINEIGFFPIAFIDMIVRLEEKVPYYLDKFSQPFDKLIFLQTSADGLPLKDVSDSINNMVINNIRSDIELNEEVLKNIYSRQVQNIKDLLDSDEFDERLNNKLTILIDRLKCEKRKERLEILRTIDHEDYKKVIRKVTNKPDDLNKGIHNAVNKMKQIYGRYLTKEVLKDKVEDIKETDPLFKELERVYESRYEGMIKEILPTFLMILTDTDQNYEINNLITAIKIVMYDEDRRYFAQIFENSYDFVDEEAWLKGLKTGGDPKRFLLQNKLHPGDVFFNRKDNSEMEQTCYLCIVPSCHLLRPKKVDGVILFIQGEICTEPRPEQIRDSEHFTVLPGIEEGKQPINVLWKYHRIKELDLNKMSKEEFNTLYRPYRLTYEYTRQIIGEFVAFYSKSGVDELFLNSEIPLNRLFENIPEGNADGQID